MPDDYSASTLTTGSVAIGGSTTGNIETTGDADWFAVTLTAGVTYRFDLQGSATGQGTLQHPVLQLLDSTGHMFISDTSSGGFGPAADWNSQLTYTAATTGTYYLASDPIGNDLGTYKISVTRLGGPTAVDDTISIKEDTAPNPVTGNVLANDQDADGDTLTVTNAGTFNLGHGTLALQANGNYAYTLDNANPAVNALNDGQTLTDAFTYGPVGLCVRVARCCARVDGLKVPKKHSGHPTQTIRLRLRGINNSRQMLTQVCLCTQAIRIKFNTS
jgi:hypothetical protein